MPQLFDLHSTPFNPENPTLDFGSTTQVLVAATTVVPTGGFHKISTTGVVVLTATPTIDMENAVAGQIVTFFNASAAGANTLSFARGVATKLKLGAANRVLSPDGSITLMYDGEYWIEQSFTLAPATA